MAHEAPGTATFYIYIVVVIGLVLFAGLMSGLTLGLMSLSLVDLEVLMKSGTPKDRKHAEKLQRERIALTTTVVPYVSSLTRSLEKGLAAKILPVVKRQHLLLCTLLIGNAIAMEALPIFLDSLVDAYGAIIISVTLILICSEIMPQAVCSRYGLAVGAAMSPVVRVLLIVFFPISYPISKLLDWILGENHGSLFRRAELKTLVTLHGGEAGKGGELTHDETTIISGALELTEKTASQAMTPIDLVFSLDVNAKLDLETMRNIMARGHSRIPVYAGDKKNIIGLILVKNLLTLLPHDEMSVRNCTIRKIPRYPLDPTLLFTMGDLLSDIGFPCHRVSEDSPLYDILNDFQKGHSHMAVVVKYNKEKAETIQQSRERTKERRLSTRRSFNVHVDSASSLSNKSLKRTMIEIPETKDIVVGVDDVDSAQRKQAESETRAIEQGGQLINPRFPVMKLDEDGKASGQIYPQRSKKWAKSGDQNVLEIHEDGPLPTFEDEEVVGIITMEDLIEELLQEEILDETDDYVDIHNKIKVNLLLTGESPVSPTLDMQSVHATGNQHTPMRASPGMNTLSASPWKSPLASPRTAPMCPAIARTVSST